MKLVVLILCALTAVGVFAAMFFAVWTSHRNASAAATFRQSLAMELMWAAIPFLIVVAAAFPAVLAIAGESAGDSPHQFWN